MNGHKGFKKKEHVTRHPLKHTKSHSTTSLTKGAVILTSSTQAITLPRKTTITFAEPDLSRQPTVHDPTTAMMDTQSSAALEALMHLTGRHASFVVELDLPLIVLRGRPQETGGLLTESMAEIVSGLDSILFLFIQSRLDSTVCAQEVSCGFRLEVVVQSG